MPLRSVLFQHLHDGRLVANLENIPIKICITKFKVRWNHTDVPFWARRRLQIWVRRFAIWMAAAISAENCCDHVNKASCSPVEA